MATWQAIWTNQVSSSKLRHMTSQTDCCSQIQIKHVSLKGARSKAACFSVREVYLEGLKGSEKYGTRRIFHLS